MKDDAVSPLLLFDPDRQRRLIEGMIERVAASRHDYWRIRHQQEQSSVGLEQQLAEQLAAVKSHCHQDRRTTLVQWDAAEEQAIAAYEAATMQLHDQLRRMSTKYRRRAAEQEAVVAGKVQKRVTAVNDQYNARKDQPAKQRRHEHRQLDEALHGGDADLKWSRELTIRRLDRLLSVDARSNHYEEFGEVEPGSVRDAIDLINRLNRRLSATVAEMQSGAASKIVDSFYLPAGVAVFILIWVMTAVVVKADPLLWWMICSVPVAGLLGFSIYLILLWPLKRMTRRLHPLCERIRLASESAVAVGKAISTRLTEDAAHELLSRRELHLAEAKRWQVEQVAEIQSKIAAEQAADRATLEAELQQVDQQFRDGFALLQKTMRDRANEIAATISQKLTSTDQMVGQTRQQVLTQHRTTLQSLADRLAIGLKRGIARIESTSTTMYQRFPGWPDVLRMPDETKTPIDFLPLGSFRLGSSLKRRLNDAIEQHSPSDTDRSSSDEAAATPLALLRDLDVPESLPLVLHRRKHCGVIIDAPASHIDEAVAIAHQLLWRLLSSAPPGQARLTLIDSAGRGQNFASFMALADHDPGLIHHRVWTNGEKIAQRLAELTHQMEDVLQSSLRDRFERIEDYNAVAGSLAQPYQAIAAVGFPEGLSREAYLHLQSLIQSGVRCGVFVILVLQRGKPWPGDMPCPDSARLLRLGYHSDAEEVPSSETPPELPRGGPRRNYVSGGHWRCESSGLDSLEFRPLPPPPPDVREPLLRRIGTAAVAAAQIVVPLPTLWPGGRLPSADQTASTRHEVAITIGSQGAGRSQSLLLGHGVRQHVLIAGKTGSGKSTLLHSLITAGAAAYRPDELNFYLLDFKKGVEFKIYADHALTHARVIGIESEREFGRSVLQRLDQELATRGEAFRAAGVGELEEFRAARSDVTLPRIMLVIDEFQELFTRDDALASDCTSLLDRLVRQGRSFGVHVVLSSQSLAGANSLPRATLGQMAVRIAMMCGESDAALILADDNTAARLLHRPGEAIYNDAGGLIEGNHPFQVAWLDQVTHRDLLMQISDRDQDFSDALGPAIVFEGNRPGRFTADAARRAIAAASRGDVIVGLLGEAVELGPATTLRLPAATGRNVLLVAPSKMRTGVLASVIATASVHRPELAITLLDGARADEGTTTAQWCAACDVKVEVIRPRDAESAMIGLAELVKSRMAIEAAADSVPSPHLVVIDSIDRLRDLRQDDTFTFSLDGGGGASGGVALQSVLRDGPAVGVFTIISLGSAETLSRWLPRSSHHDLEVRLIGPLNAADSSLLIDSPMASDLSTATMILYDEADGRTEKFRLCEPPTVDELMALQQATNVEN